MYTYKQAKPTTAMRNDSYEGETIEMKMRRVLQNEEGIKDGAERFFTERKDGVLPETNIRTDRMAVAVEATDKIQQNRWLQRQMGQDKRANIKRNYETGEIIKPDDKAA